MLTFLMIAFISFFVISGVFLTIEARIRSQKVGARTTSRSEVSKSAQTSDTESDVRRAA